VLEDRADEARVVVLAGLAEVRRLADFPQPDQIGAILGAAQDHLVARELAQRDLVLAFLRQLQARRRRRDGQGAHQPLKRLEIELRVAPFGRRHRREAVAFDRRDEVLIHVRALAGDAERPVLAIASGAPADLADFLRRQPARAAAVEFAQAGEGDMVDVHVQPHADRVGGDEKIDLAGLEQGDLRIAGARAERAHHHRRAAALAANQLRDRIDGLGGEGDDRAAPGQTRQLLGAVVKQLGEALARLDVGVRTESSDQRRDRRRAEQHGLGLAARMQQAMGEDMAALGIGAKLDFVDRHELDRPVERHRLDRADEILRPGRDDFLFAGDQGDAGCATRLDDSIVDFARQKPERQADHARGEAQHALDGEMRLTGVGRAENSDEARFRGPMHGYRRRSEDSPPQTPPGHIKIGRLRSGSAASASRNREYPDRRACQKASSTKPAQPS
jgi:hypothetical protein